MVSVGGSGAGWGCGGVGYAIHGGRMRSASLGAIPQAPGGVMSFGL